MSERIKIPEKTKSELIFKTNNSCCICQTPFIQIHHLDGDPSNNELNNLIGLCPNCHSQAESKFKMTNNLTSVRLKQIRDKWYSYCEYRKESSVNISKNFNLKVILFIREIGFPQYGWGKTFGDLNPEYQKLTREEIAKRVFATTNPEDLKSILNTVKNMYQKQLGFKLLKDNKSARNRFRDLCNTFGFNYDIIEGIIKED